MTCVSLHSNAESPARAPKIHTATILELRKGMSAIPQAMRAAAASPRCPPLAYAHQLLSNKQLARHTDQSTPLMPSFRTPNRQTRAVQPPSSTPYKQQQHTGNACERARAILLPPIAPSCSTNLQRHPAYPQAPAPKPPRIVAYISIPDTRRTPVSPTDEGGVGRKNRAQVHPTQQSHSNTYNQCGCSCQ